MTLIELLCFIFMIAVGMGVAGPMGNRFGLVGYVLGFALGAAGGFAGLAAFSRLVIFVFDFFWHGIPNHPRCKHGKCSKNDYEVTEAATWRCKCGQQYKKQGRRFFELDAEGNRLPYLKWVPFRGWMPDEGRPR